MKNFCDISWLLSFFLYALNTTTWSRVQGSKVELCVRRSTDRGAIFISVLYVDMRCTHARLDTILPYRNRDISARAHGLPYSRHESSEMRAQGYYVSRFTFLVVLILLSDVTRYIVARVCHACHA